VSEWRKQSIADVAAPSKNALVGGPFGSNLVSRDYTPAGVPVIRGQNMGFGRWVSGEFVFVSENKAEDLSANIARPGDLVFTQRGTLGQVAIVPTASFDRYIISQSQMKLTVDPAKADTKFLFYFFTSEEQQDYIRRNAIQTGVPHTNLGHLRTTPLLLPPLSEQRAIASVLGALDDKIELNRRMNETLEALAQSLFKSWFVDATQSALPKGWRAGKVSELATLSRDGLNPGEFPDETFDHYSLPAFDEGRTPKPERGDTIMSNKFIVPSNCVMVSKLNPRIPRIWLPDLRGQNRAVCSTEFLVATPKLGVSREFLYCLFINESFVNVFTTMVTGTSGSHQRVRPESLLNMDTPLPPAPLIQKFTDTVAPMLKRISQNIHESRTLAALRDALLPKLLSGELRVADGKEVVHNPGRHTV
jgi:type I restriction enzyme S subunit